MRAVDDVAALRADVYQRVLDAVVKAKPVTAQGKSLVLTNVHYAKDDPDYDLRDEKKALLRRGSLTRRLRGTWQLRDDATGKVLSERETVVANVPAILHDGSFINRGTRYVMGYQQRLRAGAYTRKRSSGEVETHVNIAPGHGRSHRYVLTPENQQFSLQIANANVPLVTLLETLGVGREEVEQAWGKDIAKANYAKRDPKALPKLYERIVPKRLQAAGDKHDAEAMREKIRTAFEDMVVDPEVMRRTIGIETDRVTPEAILAATKKVLAVTRNEAEVDDRDHPMFASFHGADDIFAERLERDHGRLRQQLLFKALRKANLDSIPSSALDKQLEAAVFRSGLASTVEEINPAEMLSGLTKLTRYGEGGLPDTTSTPDESRNVSQGQFGFVDIMVTPECFLGHGWVYTKQGWRRWEDVDQRTQFACMIDGELQFREPITLYSSGYFGPLVRVQIGDESLLVTPSHRIWSQSSRRHSHYEFEVASNLCGRTLPALGGVGRPRERSSNWREVAITLEALPGAAAHKVYCATVPGQLLYVKASHNSTQGLWIGNSLKVGVDGYLTRAARIGRDNKLYIPVKNKAGEEELMTPGDLADKTFSIGRSPIKGFDVMIQDNKMRMLPREQADYYLPDGEAMFGQAAGLTPLKSAMFMQRGSMAARMGGQALPVDDAEAPLVQTGVPGTEYDSFEARLGERFGAVRAKQGGRVLKVEPDLLTVRYENGEIGKIPLDNNRPGARKSLFHHDALVQPGQRFEPGQLLAKSNFTDKEGVTALGRNLRAALMSWGDNWEDGMIVSESAAKAMRVQQAYKYAMDKADGNTIGKKDYVIRFGNRFGAEQFENIDDSGVIKPGTKVKQGDPLILAVRLRNDVKSRVHRQGALNYSDATLRWDHANDGIVTDVYDDETGKQVVVRTSSPLEVGSKISARQGNKGVVTILPDSEMPHDAEGNPVDLLISPQSVPSRGNSSFPIEMLLAKVAKKRGRPYRINDFEDRDLWQFALQEAEKYGVPVKEDMVDPKTGRKIPGIHVGPLFTMALSHTAESKVSARGLGSYTADGSPARGPGENASAKRLSGQQLYAHLAHGAYELSREGALLRGQRQDDYWAAYMSGRPIGMPQVSEQYEGLVAKLKAAGINPVRSGSKTQLMAFTDKDTEKLAGNRVVTVADTVDMYKDLAPIKGGLFDERIFGDGTKFGMIELPEKIPNPVFEDSIKRLLDLTDKQYRGILAGREELKGYGSGPQALEKRLAAIDVDAEIERARQDIAGTRKGARDKAVRRLQHLQGFKRSGVHPQETLISKVPVLPTRFRPISPLKGNKGVIVDDANYLYKELMLASENVRDLKESGVDTGDELLAMYDAHKSLVGLTEPTSSELKQRSVKGILASVLGRGGPKTSLFQRKLLSGNVDTVGRGVIMVDSSLDMDSAGLPEPLAFKIYEPYVVRRLVQSGVPRAVAAEYVKERHERARSALIQEMESRPVTITRAPVLHKYGDLGFNPRLIKGHAVRLNPAVYSPMGGDNDGDDQIAKVFVLLPKDALCNDHRSVYSNILPDKEAGEMYRDARIPTYDTEANELHLIDLEDFPHGDFSNRVDGANGPIDYYHALPGTRVMAYDEQAKELVWADVAYYSKHMQREVEIVNLANGMQIITDDDPRAVYGVPLGDGRLTLQRATPTDALQRKFAVPFSTDVNELVGQVEIESVHVEGFPWSRLQLNFDSGYWLGVMAGDGWVDKKEVDERFIRFSWGMHISDLHGFNVARVQKIMARIFPTELKWHRKEFRKEVIPTRYGDTVRHTCLSPEYGEAICKFVSQAVGGFKGDNHAGSGDKHLPAFAFTAPESFRRGLLCGLIDTDGNCSVGEYKSKPQLMLSITSTSLRLLRDARLLCRTLGIHATIGFSKTTSRGNSAWLLTISTVDAKRINLGEDFATPHKRENFLHTPVGATSSVAVRQDLVPLPLDVCDALLTALNGTKHANFTDEQTAILVRSWDAIAAAKKSGMISRFSAARVLLLYTELMLWRVKRRKELLVSLAAPDGLTPQCAVDVLAILSQSVSPPRGTSDAKVWAANRTTLYNVAKGKNVTVAAKDRVLSILSTSKLLGESECELIDQWAKIVNNTSVRWSLVESVEKTGEKQDGYDLTVPGYETFVDDQGVVLSNTVNVHVPHSQKVIDEIRERMMPSRMLISESDFKSPTFTPSQDMLLGLSIASGLGKREGQRTRYFVSAADAIKAYKRGEIDIDTPVKIAKP